MINPITLLIVACVLANFGLWLMLPREPADQRVPTAGKAGAASRWFGAILLAMSAGLLAARLPLLAAVTTQGLFYVFAGVTLVGAVGTITSRRAVYAGAWFGLAVVGSAALMLLVGAQFTALAVIAVYVGAVLVTLLFVLMLADPEGDAPCDRLSLDPSLSAGVAVLLIGLMTAIVAGEIKGVASKGTAASDATAAAPAEMPARQAKPTSTGQIGAALYSRALPTVLIAGLLLFIALVGAVVVAERGRIEAEETHQPEAQARGNTG